MAKLKLNFDAPAPTFSRKVALPTETGKPLEVTFTFKHRDRLALAELQDEYEARAKASSEPTESDDPAPKISNAERMQQVIDSDVQTIMDVATGWNIDAPFDADNLAKLCRRYPGAAMAILIDYRISCGQGRLGN